MGQGSGLVIDQVVKSEELSRRKILVFRRCLSSYVVVRFSPNSPVGVAAIFEIIDFTSFCIPIGERHSDLGMHEQTDLGEL